EVGGVVHLGVVGRRVGEQLGRAAGSGYLVGASAADLDRVARARVRELPDRTLVRGALNTRRVARAVLVRAEQDPLDPLGTRGEAGADRVLRVAVVEREIAAGTNRGRVGVSADGRLDAVPDLRARDERIREDVPGMHGVDREVVEPEAAMAREARIDADAR